jgi:hypothetical protein
MVSTAMKPPMGEKNTPTALRYSPPFHNQRDGETHSIRVFVNHNRGGTMSAPCRRVDELMIAFSPYDHHQVATTDQNLSNHQKLPLS